MRISLFTLIILLNLNLLSQSKKIDNNIKKLDNNEFEIKHNGTPDFFMKSSAAKKLIKIGKPAVQKLIIALNDSTKTIMAHLVLCHICFKHVSFAGPKMISTDSDHINIYYLGEEKGEGLLISEIEKPKGTYRKFIQEKDLQKIKLYWTKKVKS